MRLRDVLLGAAFSVGVLIVACGGDDDSSSSGSSSGTNSSGGACTDAQKTCNGNCVSKDDPNVGCATASCTPCEARTNAAPACKSGACGFDCNAGFADCDGNPANGCESPTNGDPTNCGACGNVCGNANVSSAPSCQQGKCTWACTNGYAHCGAKDDSGCDSNIQTSKDHCGACGHSCLGGECIAGKCQAFKLVSMQNPTGVASDANYVYISSLQAMTVSRVEHDGNCPGGVACPELFAGTVKGDAELAMRGAAAIVADGANVYWIGQAGPRLSYKGVTGGAIVKTITGGNGGLPGMLAIGGGKVWWTSSSAPTDPGPHLFRADLNLDNVTVMADYANPSASNDGVGGLAVDATNVFWGSPSFGLYKATHTAAKCTEGGAGTCVIGADGGTLNVFGVAVDNVNVYWTETGGGTASAGQVKRAPKAGGQAVLVAMEQDNPRSIAVLDGFVYWANEGTNAPTGGSIRRAPTNVAPCTGDACEKVGAAEKPVAVHAGNDGVYWTDEVLQGAVWRFAK